MCSITRSFLLAVSFFNFLLQIQSDTELQNCTTCKLPIFSWDYLPVFFHSSQDKTDSDGSFTREALNIITKFPIVTIEKWQGDKASQWVSEDDAMIASAINIKKINPNISVIVWFDSVRIYANQSLNPDAKKGCDTGHFLPAVFLESHPEYLLMNTTGQPALETGSGCHIYAFQKKIVRDYWRNRCLNMTKTGVIDGCGADASFQTGESWNISDDIRKKWIAGHKQTMAETTTSLGNGILLGKEKKELGDYVNGILSETCKNNNATINTLLYATELSQKQGRPLIYECHAKNCTGDDCLNSISAFLIGAGPYHFWGWGKWHNESFSDRWMPKFFDQPLGKPKGDAVYDVVSQTWTRHFQSGTKVTFNTKNNKGNISWSNNFNKNK